MGGGEGGGANAPGIAITPALLITTSTTLVRFLRSSAARSIDPRSARSRSSSSADPPEPSGIPLSTSSTAFLPRASSREHKNTLAPEPASRAAVSFPSPVLAPVTTTVRGGSGGTA